MLKMARWRVVLVLLIAALGLLFAAPNVIPEGVRRYVPLLGQLKPVNLGLDLRGGVHLAYEVDLATMRKQQLETAVDDMARALRQASPRISYTGRGVIGDAARMRIVNPEETARAIEVLEKEVVRQVPGGGGFGQTTATIILTSTPDGAIEARFSEPALEGLARQAIDQSIEVIRRRVDPTGASEVSITRQGDDRIIVQAPGESDPESLKSRIGRTALMTFHLVDPNVSPLEAAEGRAPPGTKIVPGGRGEEPFVAIKERALLSGEDLANARADFEQQTGEPIISFRFNQRGTRIFGKVTQEHTNERFAIVLDDKVLTAPVIREPILGGSGQISGGFTVEYAKETADLLNAGALPVPLEIIEQRTVGAELGQDAINAGAFAGVLAAISILAFMVIAYGLFGFFACIALVINFVLIIAAMSAFGASLTMPGIAGLILTIAIAVDANVLIFERMRDEQRAGRGPAMAIETGFSRAMVTIMDANITTILAAAILFQFGAGPVQGFAWTLSIGTITSVFTSVLVVQLIIAMWFRTSRPKTLPI